jgi:hypothetical protein
MTVAHHAAHELNLQRRNCQARRALRLATGATVETLEERQLLSGYEPATTPFVIVHGLFGSLNRDPYQNEWYANRGIHPDKLVLDPLAGLYDDIVQTMIDRYAPKMRWLLGTFDFVFPNPDNLNDPVAAELDPISPQHKANNPAATPGVVTHLEPIERKNDWLIDLNDGLDHLALAVIGSGVLDPALSRLRDQTSGQATAAGLRSGLKILQGYLRTGDDTDAFYNKPIPLIGQSLNGLLQPEAMLTRLLIDPLLDDLDDVTFGENAVEKLQAAVVKLRDKTLYDDPQLQPTIASGDG